MGRFYAMHESLSHAFILNGNQANDSKSGVKRNIRKLISQSKILITLLFVLSSFSFVRAQVASYSFAQSSNSYSAVSGTALSAVGWDDNLYTAAIPFSFTFNGIAYNSCSVNTNGYLTFGSTLSSNTGYSPISAATAYAGAVSAFGRDLINSSGSTSGTGTTIQTTTLNSTPNRIFVIQWSGARRYSLGALADNLNFQIRLYETSNKVEIMYGACTAASTSLTCQVGLRGATNADFNNRSSTTSWSATSAGGSNSSSVTSTNAILPASGLTFTWSPPTPPSCISSPTSPADATSGFTGNTLTWSNPGTATSYDVYFGTNNPPTNIVNGTNQATTSYVPSSLSSNTTYYWKIVPRNSAGAATGTCSVWSFTTGLVYCIPAYTNACSSSDFINNFSINTLSNSSSGCNGNTNNYIKYPSSSFTTSLFQGTAYNASVSIGSGGSGNVGIWIDYNDNGTYETTERSVNSTLIASSGSQTISVAVPSGAALGQHSMRVREIYSTSLAVIDPCAGAAYGEVEDYTVTIAALPTPPSCISSPSSPADGTSGFVGNTLTWSNPGTATSYDVYFGTNNPPTNIVNGTNQATTSYVPSSLSGNTTYYWKIVPRNAGGAATGTCSVWSFTTGLVYCIPAYTNACSSSDFINNFSINTLSNTSSGCNGNTNNYIKYPSSSFTTSLSQGTAYNASVSIGSGGSGNVGIWIDYNDNGTYETSERSVNSTLIASSGTQTISVAVPSGAALGQHSMRVREIYSTSLAVVDPCAGATYGEVEDYTVTITGPTIPSCIGSPTAPSNGATGIAISGTTLSWPSPSPANATGYDVYFGTTNPPTNLVSGNQSGTTYPTGALTSSTTYYWSIVPRNSAGSAGTCSVWSFTTVSPPNCTTNLTPANGALSAITYNTTTNLGYVNISWNAASGAASYDLFFNSFNPPVSNLGNFTGTTVNVTGLTAGNTYYWYVVPKNSAGSAVGCVSSTTSFSTACLNTAYTSPYPTASFTPACSGSPESIATDCYAGEYSNVNVISGTTYTFSSSNNADFITISNSGATAVLASGNSSVNWTATLTGTVRFYTHFNTACGTEAVDRARRVQCTPSTPPCISSPTSPANGSTGIALTGTTLSWSNPGNATGYDVYFGNPLPSTPNSVNQSGTTFTTGPLSGSTTYFWKIVPKNAGGTASGCNTWSFTTVPPPPANDICTGAVEISCGGSATVDNTYATDDALPNPTAGCTTSTNGLVKGIWFKVTPTVSGSLTVSSCNTLPSTDTYLRIYQGNCSAFSSCMGFDDDGCGTLSTVTFTASANTTYYILCGLYSSTKTPGPITVSVTCPIEAPVANNVTGCDNNFTASWSSIAGATNYSLDVSTSNTFNTTNTNVAGWSFSTFNLQSDAGNANNTGANAKTLSTAGGTSAISSVGSGASLAALASGWDNGSGVKYWQVADLNTTGMYNLKLSSDQLSSNTGPKDFKVQYKIGAAGVWTDVSGGTITITSNSTFTSLTNLSLPAVCENQSSVYLRWIMTSNTNLNLASVAGGGTSRISHIYITGNSVLNLSVSAPATSQLITGLLPNTTYYYQVRAISGNSISVNSNTATGIVNSTPVLTCPSDISVNSSSGQCGAVVSFSAAATGTPAPSVTYSKNPGTLFPVGTTVVTATAVNTCGTATCSFNVTVNDNIAPTLSCQNAVLSLDASGSATLSLSDIKISSSDNCTISTEVLSKTSYNCSNVGNNLVTLTVTDNNGNTATCQKQVTVQDLVKPNAICKNIMIDLSPDLGGGTTIIGEQVNNGSTDNCTIASYSVTPSGFSCNDIGVPKTVTLTVTDVNNNTGTCTATVSVRDVDIPNVSPLAKCLPNVTVSIGKAAPVTINASNLNNGSFDNCGFASLVVSPNTFTCADIGAPITVTLTGTDASGNSSTCTSQVSIIDDINPDAVCQNTTIQLDNSGNAVITASSVNNGSSDNCGIPTLSISESSFNCSNIGANQVTLTVTDNYTNTSSCYATVTVEDHIAPNAVCQDITVELDATGNGSITASQIDNGSSDVCSAVSLSASQTAFTCSNIGNNTVTLTVTDASLNNSTCSATVTVKDVTAPNAVCKNVTVQLDATGNGSITADAVDNGSTDNCAIAAKELSNSNFACGNVGSSNIITLTITDVNGNAGTCSGTVTVEDHIAPVAVCKDITLQLDAGGNVSIAASAVNNGSNDACGIGAGGYALTQTAFHCADIGANSEVLTVTDVNGNSSTCSTVITVEDNIAPQTLCQNIMVQLDSTGSGKTTVTAIDNGSTDACGLLPQCGPHGPMVTCLSGLMLSKSTFDCSNIGPNTIVLTATDNNYNSSTCTATVTVVDNIAPVALCQNVTVQLDNTGHGSTTAAAVNNGSRDACGIQSLSLSQTDFVCSEVGPRTVTLTVKDVNNNISYCSSTVTVVDAIAPVALCKNITIQLSAAGTASVAPSQVNNGSSDACGIQNLSVTPNSFTCANVGANTVVLKVTDVNGNSSTCSSVVTVQDLVAPVAICKNISVALDANGGASITPAQINNGSSDACGVANLSITSASSFNCTNTGANTVILKVTDVNGNTSTCTSVVTVTGGALYNYVMLASKEVHLHHSNVQSGGIGITTTTGEAEIEEYTTVTAPGTFVQAVNIDVNSGATVTTQLHTVANAPLPVFETNPYSSNNNIKVLSGQTVTLTDSVYNQVKIEKYGTVIFTQPVVNIKHLEGKEFSVIKFTQCTKVRMKEHLHIMRNSQFNPDGLGVTVFAPSDVDVKEGSKVYATIYSLKDIKVSGKATNRTQMTGLFIAVSISKGDYTDWNANTQCGRCSVVPGLFARISATNDVSCDGATNGSATVSATGGSAPYTYLWSNGQTTATATNLAPGSYTVTVKDALGATKVVNTDIVVFTYTLLASEEIKLSKNDTVFSGSVGITNVNGKVNVDNNSGVTGDDAIVIAPIINIDATSTVNDTIFGIANTVAFAFEGNIPYVNNSDLNVANGTSYTMLAADTIRRKITIGDNATLIVSAGVLNVTDKLDMKKNSKIRFSAACTKVRIKGDLTTDDNPTINPDGQQVTFHVNGNNVKFGKNAKVTATIYAPNSNFDLANASAATPNIMRGKFIAKKISSGEYTNWYESTACPCNSGSGAVSFSKPSPTPTDNTTAITSAMRLTAYPNPFRNTTTISFTLPESTENARLSVYNLEGREVKLLYNGPADEQVEYKFQLDTDKSMDSGLYFYRVQTKEGKTAVSKLILTK